MAGNHFANGQNPPGITGVPPASREQKTGTRRRHASAPRNCTPAAANETLFFRELREDLVGFLQRFLRTDVEPGAGNAPGVNRRARVKPLHQPAGLVGIVALGEVLLDEWNRTLRIKVKRNARECARRFFRFFLEESDATGGVRGNSVVFLDLVEVARVVEREDRSFLFATKLPEPVQPITEQIIARSHLFPCQNLELPAGACRQS